MLLLVGLGCESERAVRSNVADGQLLADLATLGSASEGSQGNRPFRDTMARYQDFIGQQQAVLAKPGTPEQDRRVGQEALWCMRERMYGGPESALERTSPQELYFRCRAKALSAMRREEELARAKEAKRDEYWRWALRQWGEGSLRFERPGKAYLVTLPESHREAFDVLTRAVLDWALTHEDDPAFLQRSPSEVALYLLARESALSTAVRRGQLARGHLDYSPDLDPNRYTEEQLVVELVVGFIPVVGEVALALEVVTGTSITGHQLEEEDRVFLFICGLLPFAPAVVARSGELAGALERTALLTGRSVQETQVLARVASHLSPEDVAEIERLIKQVAGGRHLTAEELAHLEAIAQKLKLPLENLAELASKGAKVPLLGSRAMGAGGAPLVIGSAEHMAQCWIEYQFRYPQRFKRFSYLVDPAWEKLYRNIIKNSEAGGEFEKAVLASQKYERNVLPLMPPPGETMEGFIADAVKGNPGELVWGKPYHLVEVKGRAEMALTGNLNAMIKYVQKYGGKLEIWFRSPKYPAGATRLTQPLQNELKDLASKGKVIVDSFPK